MQNEIQPISVSEFLAQINAVLVQVPAFVEGEVAGVRVSQGRWLHFDLKDEEENALVQCFAPVFRIRTPLEDGMRVRVKGVARIYPRFGKFSINLETVEPSGEGALRRAFELLRQKLEAEGLFLFERKRALPRFPERIGLVTSREAAAYDDFIKVLRTRRGGMEIRFIPVSVQGESAPSQIISAIQYMNEAHRDLEAIVVVRGGGNLEDLHAFNSEDVVRAIARSRIPTVVGVGHERDISLADLVSDVRASTPSNAAELLTPTRDEIRQMVDTLHRRLCTAQREELDRLSTKVIRNVAILRDSVDRPLRTVDALSHRMKNMGRILHMGISQHYASTNEAGDTLRNMYVTTLRKHGEQLASSERIMASLHPKHVLARGYSITKTKNGSVLRDPSEVTAGDILTSVLHRGILNSSVCQNKPKISQKRTKNSNKSSRSSKQATLM